MERVSSQHDLLLQHAFASNSSASSPRRETLAAGEEEGVETMHAGGEEEGGLSAAEKGKQKADDADLPGAGGLSAVDMGKQKADDPGAGVLRHALGLRRAVLPRATTEIEEAPPSPPPPPSLLRAVSQPERNQATLGFLEAELQHLRPRGGLGVGDGSSSKVLQGGEPQLGDEAKWCAGVVPSAAVSEIEEAPPSPPPLPGPAALALMASQMQQQEGRERGEGGSARRPEGEDADAAAGMQMLEHELETMHESLSCCRDRMVALRLQEEELRAFEESLKAWERKNSKIGGTCNWKRIISAITFASGLVFLILFGTQLPLYYVTHIVAAMISALWILGTSIAFCRQLYGTSRTIKGFSRHIVQLLCVCFLLLVLYILYLVLRLLGGTFTGLLGKRP